MRHDPAGTARVIGGASTKRTSKSPGAGSICTRAIDQFGQVIDVLVTEKRDLAATRRFITLALAHGPSPTEVTTDRAATYPRVHDELLPSACHVTEQYANNPVERGHYELALDFDLNHRLLMVFTELA